LPTTRTQFKNGRLIFQCTFWPSWSEDFDGTDRSQGTVTRKVLSIW